MTAPYATVILPTLNRASTLPFALASVQAQSVQSLEIFVVLDGATAACRDAAASIARTDGRIRIFDLPKGRGGGADSIDHAIMRASAQRIFYIDDDDLWLPDHVAQLGPLLEFADVADSRVCSVDRNGGTHLAACRGSNGRVRELLGRRPPQDALRHARRAPEGCIRADCTMGVRGASGHRGVSCGAGQKSGVPLVVLRRRDRAVVPRGRTQGHVRRVARR